MVRGNAEQPALVTDQPAVVTPKIIPFSLPLRWFVFLGLVITLIVAANTTILATVLDALLGVTWSAPIVQFIKQNTQGLIVILLLSIYLEHVRPTRAERGEIDRAVQGFRSELRRLENLIVTRNLETVSPQLVLEQVLKNRYGSAAQVANLVRTLLPEKHHYRDVSVNYTLIDDPADERLLTLQYELRFSARIEEFVVALVPSPVLQDAVCADGDRIHDVFTCSNSDNQRLNMQKLLGSSSAVRVITTGSSGVSSEVLCRFASVPQSELPKYLPSLAQDELGQIDLVRCVLPPESDDQRIITVAHEFSLCKDDHYCYWLADRPMFIERISFDVSRFMVARTARFNVQPFMANCSVRSSRLASGPVFTIDVRNWLVKGQGAILSWRD